MILKHFLINYVHSSDCELISIELLRGYLGGVDGESSLITRPARCPAESHTSLSISPSLPSTDATLSGLATSQGWEVVAETMR